MWVAITAFAVVVAYAPGLPEPGQTGRWLVLALLAPLMLLGAPRRPITPPMVLAALWAAWAAMTLTWSVSPWGSAEAVLHLGALAAVAWSAPADPRGPLLAFASGIALCGLVALAETLGLIVLPVAANPPSGLFSNKNYLAEAGAAALVAVIALRSWVLVPFIALALVLPGARGASAAVIIAGIAALNGRWRAAALALVAVTAAVAAALGFLSTDTLAQRFDLWASSLPALSWHGWGLGAFNEAFQIFQRGSAPPVYGFNATPGHAHNDALEMVVTTGAPALLLFTGFGLVLWRARGGLGHDPAALALLAILVAGLVGFPLANPATAFVAALCFGSLAWRWDRLGCSDAFGRAGLHACRQRKRNVGDHA